MNRASFFIFIIPTNAQLIS